MSSAEDLTRQWARLRALLSEERIGTRLVPASPVLPATALGALDAIGFVTNVPEVWVSVYVFANGGARRAARDTLTARHRGDARSYGRTATNGPMLFDAHARVDGRDGREAEAQLDRILTAFSGDE